ncbi:MAG: flagellin [Planctomycetes bacterium]|nr:flagellin [Planctomycetota bacterium]
MTRINTNIAALIARTRLGVNQRDLELRLERLATGLRINRGADDPAGLIASEVLRSEVRTIAQAIDNSNRAINVLSTAEGALNELSALLLELNALVTATANESALLSEEVAANQLVVDSILASIDRIANSTEFGGKKLLNGSMDYRLSGVSTSALAGTQIFAARLPRGTTREVTVQILASAQTAQLVFSAVAGGGNITSDTTLEISGLLGSEIISFASGTSMSTITNALNDATAVTGVSAVLSTTGGGVQTLLLNSTEFGSDAFVSVHPITGNFMQSTPGGTTADDFGQDVSALVNGQTAAGDGLVVDIRAGGLDARFYLTTAFGTQLGTSTFDITGGGAIYQITPEVSPVGQVFLGLQSISTANLGNTEVGILRSIGSGQANQVSAGNTTAAQKIINAAITQVAGLRGRLGNLQRNQIETNINSQQIALENVTAAESVIRDADIAEEVAALTRAQVLVSSTQTTLLIANQIPQSVLALLS